MMNCIRVAWLFSVFIIGISASTHWMVTESGLIQPRLDSPFEMVNPYDLLAFLNQDTRWENIITLYHDLSKRKDVIRKLWSDLERDSDVKTQLSVDKNCIISGPLNQMDWLTSTLEDGKSRNIPDKDFNLYNPYVGEITEVPDCKKISSLTFSMFAFEHLLAMSQRENLTVDAELSMPEQISPIMNLDQFGHWLSNMLKHNSSSWLHYNMASLYWRVRGNGPKAVECCRRAVHYAPREYKDIALLSLGTVFHRSMKAEDSLIVLSAAVDHSPNQPINHFMLGNAYAEVGDFNSSVRHFNTCLKLNPKFDLAKKHKHGVLCHITLVSKMKIIQGLLDELRAELLEYSRRETMWLKSQAAFLRTMKHPDDFDYRDVEKNCEKMAQLTGLDIKELKKEGDKNSLISYFLDNNNKFMSGSGVRAVESAYSFQTLVKHIDEHADMVSELTPEQMMSEDGIKKEIGPTPEFDGVKGKADRVNDKNRSGTSTVKDYFELEGGRVLNPPTMKLQRNKETFDRDPEWPSSAFCKTVEYPKNMDAIYPIFLPFENKGIRMTSVLSEMIGIPVSKEHELPWHPPICNQDSSAFSIKKTNKPQMSVEVADASYLKLKLLEYVGDGDTEAAKNKQHAEIGQRIYAAIQKQIAPKWFLYTLSSLYWRVRGNNINAINCLIPANKAVPQRHKDVTLISLSSVYLELGYFDEAMTAAEEAFKLNMYEPATNIMIAQLNMLLKQRNTQIFHLKQAARVQTHFMGGLPLQLLYSWACMLKHRTDIDFGENDVCTQVEPGLSMVCDKDGVNCHMTNVQCFNSNGREKPESSTLVRMLELKGDDIQSSSADIMDDSIFDEFLYNMPEKRSDIAAHELNYKRMRKTIDSTLRGCGERGCNNIQAEDLALQEEDCSYQHLQLGYWLHIISFRQMLIDANLRLPTEIISMNPSTTKIPECRLFSEPSEDFFLERLSRLDVERWEPVIGLMHQFAETFNFFDYVALGSKIAKYVETRPRDWVGLLSAGWWCGAGGHGRCALRCLMSAATVAPPAHREPLLSITALLHMQTKLEDAKDVAYLLFYMSPKSKMEAYLVAVSHTYLLEYEQAVWMYRYSLTFDEKFLPAKACLHATMCLMLFGEKSKDKPKN